MRVEEEKILLPGGEELVFRNPEKGDAELLIHHMRTVCGETRFLVREPDEIVADLEEERRFIQAQNEAPGSLMLLGFLNGDYVGNCFFTSFGCRRCRHRATMGIALYQAYTGRGIGSRLIEAALTAAKNAGIEQMELEVAVENQRAVSLYQKIGFEILGSCPHYLKYGDGSYADAYRMVKIL